MQNPFHSALGNRMSELSPAVQAHFSLTEGSACYTGVMKRIWRKEGWQGYLAYPILWLGSFLDTLFPNTGENIPFQLINTIIPIEEGKGNMEWNRSFYFPNGVRHFNALMHYDAENAVILDWFGTLHHLEAELHPATEAGHFVMESGKQRLRLGGLKIPLPSFVAGKAIVREWEQPDGSLGISVTLHNPLLGAFFGYEGSFSKKNDWQP